MTPTQLLPHVASLFPRGRARTTRVAVEQEFLVADPAGTAVSVDRVLAALGPAVGAFSFEPGGQVELQTAPMGDADQLAARLLAATGALGSDLARYGIVATAAPVDHRSTAELPLQLTTPRYLAMQRHFDRIGPAGRRMMRATASTQVCLDWWPGPAGREQWELALLAAPFLAAAYARSAGPAGRLTTWLDVDPGRTAFDDRLLHGGDPVAAYADFAATATVFLDPTDAVGHLTTLFPPVRPRGCYLELRFLDAQEPEDVGPVVADLARLFYDDDRRRRWLTWLSPERARLAAHWQAAASGDEDLARAGRQIVQAAPALVLR